MALRPGFSPGHCSVEGAAFCTSSAACCARAFAQFSALARTIQVASDTTDKESCTAIGQCCEPYTALDTVPSVLAFDAASGKLEHS